MALWTEDEDRVIRWAIRRGIPRKAIAAPLARSTEAIRERERRLGLIPKRRPGKGIAYRASFGWNALLVGVM